MVSFSLSIDLMAFGQGLWSICRLIAVDRKALHTMKLPLVAVFQNNNSLHGTIETKENMYFLQPLWSLLCL